MSRTTGYPHRRFVAPRTGAILIVAMIIVFALASMALVLGSFVRTEATASANQLAMQEAGAIARGAEQYVLSLLTERLDSLDQLDERDFAAVQVGKGRFWILRPDYGDQLMPVYGLTDESARINLNTAIAEQLVRLPGMTEDLAEAIVAWRSEEEDPHGQHYMSLPEAYRAKNAQFETVEELLLVRGMTRELLYGRGGTRHFAAQHYQIHGLYTYFTVWSSERNRSADGRRRIFINSNSNRQRDRLRQLIRERLSGERAAAVIGQMGSPPYVDIFDFALRTGLEAQELALIEDYITAVPFGRVRGRINVNEAPREVLVCLRGLSEDDVDRLLSHRAGAVAADPRSVAWVLEALEDRAIGLGNQITGQGRHYSADIVAVSGNGRGFQRVRILVDASVSPPRIIYRRDLTAHGWPLEASIREGLRSGGSLW